MSHGFRRALVGALAAGALGAGSVGAAAQPSSTVTSPPNIVLPNYLGVPAGPFGGLESSASVARAGDPSSAWFNPAGLSRAIGAEISGSAGLYQFTTVSPQRLDATGGSTEQLPNFVGFTVKMGPSLTAGLALVTTHSWAQNMDAQRLVQSTPEDRRLAYSSDSELSRRVGALSVAYTRGGPWRLGAGLALSFTSLNLNETTSDRRTDGSLLRTAIVSSRASGSTTHVRPLVGAQYDAGPHWRLGVMLRAPGFTVYRQGSMAFDGTVDDGDRAAGVSVFDSEARFDDRLPAELHGGVAYVADRAVVEVDVQAYSGIDRYPMMSSAEPILTYTDEAAGPPVVTATPFPGLHSASRAFANVSVGGHYVLSSTRTMRLHFGVGTDRSPVAAGDQIFGRADLFSWTLGLSGSVGRLTFAAGANVRTGTADNIEIRNPLDDQAVETEVDLMTVGLIYSISYRF
jgi:hypothetical protein